MVALHHKIFVFGFGTLFRRGGLTTNHQPPTFPTHAPTAPLFKASELADGPLFSARRLVDKSYHGHYIVERQRFQDSDLEEWASGLGS